MMRDRPDLLLGISIAFASLFIFLTVSSKKIILGAASLFGVSVLYLLLNFNDVISNGPRNKTSSSKLSEVVLFLFICFAGVTNTHLPRIHPVSITIISVIALIIVYHVLSDQYNVLTVVAIIMLAIIIRVSSFRQFGIIPGVDTVSTYIPYYHYMLEVGSITAPPGAGNTRYRIFPLSYSRFLANYAVTGGNISSTLYLTIYLPQAISVLFVYAYVRREFGNKAGMLSALFVSLAAFHIKWGFRHPPQALTTTLLPLLLFTLFRRDRRFVSLALTIIGVLLITHHAVLYLLIGYLLFYVLASLVSRHALADVDDLQRPVTPSIIFVSIVILLKLYQTASFSVSGVHNLRRFGKILASFLYLNLGGGGLSSQTPGIESGFVLLNYAFFYLVVTGIVVYGYLILVRNRWSYTPRKLSIMCAALFCWSIAGSLILVGASVPVIGRLGGALIIVTAPIFSIVVIDIDRNQMKFMPHGIIILIVLSVAITGVIHPDATVSDQLRTERAALSSEEINALQFADTFVDESIQMGDKVETYVNDDNEEVYGLGRNISSCETGLVSKFQINQRHICSSYILTRGYWNNNNLTRSNIIYTSGDGRTAARIYYNNDTDKSNT